jgi:hypothetical protein
VPGPSDAARDGARPAVLGLGAVAVLAAVVGSLVSGGAPGLVASGPVSVSGTKASAVFTIDDRTVRQVRYDDQGTLRYRFTLTNHGRLPVTVSGLADDAGDPRLFDLVGLSAVDVPPGESREITLTLAMNGCESLSSRSGSFVSTIAVTTREAGVFEDVVTVALPEELHTGSPREAFCPRSTATSRPQG